MNHETDKYSAVTFTMFFLWKRVLFALVAVYAHHSVQVFWVQFLTLALLLFITVYQPFVSGRYAKVNFFNEAMLLVTSVMCLLFTDYVSDPELRYAIGYYFLAVIYGMIGVNCCVFFYGTALDF